MNMDRFTGILVDVDAPAAVHPAMERAIEVARACDARLKVVDVLAIPDDVRGSLPQGVADAVIRRRRERLAALCAAAGGGA